MSKWVYGFYLATWALYVAALIGLTYYLVIYG